MHAKTYLYPETQSEVFVGIAGDLFATFTRPDGMTGYPERRLKSREMPAVTSEEEAQENLNDWAAKRGLEEIGRD